MVSLSHFGIRVDFSFLPFIEKSKKRGALGTIKHPKCTDATFLSIWSWPTGCICFKLSRFYPRKVGGEGSFFHWWYIFLKRNPRVYGWSGKKRWNELWENVQQDHRTVEQEATFIQQMACWATIGPNIPGAVNTVIKLVNSSVRDTGFLASFTRWLFWWGFSACDDALLPWDVYGPNKEKVLKRLWALKKEI